MRSERVLLNRAATRDHDLFRVASGCSSPPSRAPRHDRLDLLRLLHDLLGHGALDTVAGDDDAVLLARGPPLEELATDAVLQHTRASKHDAATDVLEAVEALERTDELEVPGPSLARAVSGRLGLGHSLAEETLDVVVHGTDVRLVDQHTLAGEVTGVVDGVFLVLLVLGPVLVENEQQLLGSAEGKHGHKHAAASVEDARDGLHESLFPFQPRHV
ncbi:hypothetical protein VTK26DRAFT_1826 [Humicola hyalothermophila]